MALPDRRQKEQREREELAHPEQRFHNRRAEQARRELDRVLLEGYKTLKCFRLSVLGLVVSIATLLIAYKISGCF